MSGSTPDNYIPIQLICRNLDLQIYLCIKKQFLFFFSPLLLRRSIILSIGQLLHIKFIFGLYSLCFFTIPLSSACLMSYFPCPTCLFSPFLLLTSFCSLLFSAGPYFLSKNVLDLTPNPSCYLSFEVCSCLQVLFSTF